MKYPIDRDELARGVLRLLNTDSLCKGEVPGFQIVDQVAQGATRLGETSNNLCSFLVTSPSVYASSGIDELLRVNNVSQVVKRIASTILDDVLNEASLVSSYWDYRAILRELGEETPPRALLFPEWRGRANRFPRNLSVATCASYAVDDAEVIFVFGKDGRYFINRRPDLKPMGGDSIIYLSSEVWRLGFDRPRAFRVKLQDASSIDIPSALNGPGDSVRG